MSIQTFVQNKIALVKRTALRASLLIGGALVLPLVGFVGTANAVSYNCPSAALCVYQHANGEGLRTYWGGDWSGDCWNMIPSWNNIVSSVQNNMSIGVTFYDSFDCVHTSYGDEFTVPAYTSATTFTIMFPLAMNDRASSIKFH